MRSQGYTDFFAGCGAYDLWLCYSLHIVITATTALNGAYLFAWFMGFSCPWMAQISLDLHLGHLGHAGSRQSLPRALGSPVPPKSSAKQMYLTGESTKKPEGRPSGEGRLVYKVGTDYCMHSPLGSVPRDQGFFSHVRPGKYQVLLSKTPPNRAMQPLVQACWSTQTPWPSTAHQTQGKQPIHLDVMEVASTKARYEGLIWGKRDDHCKVLLQTESRFGKDPTQSSYINQLRHLAVVPLCPHCLRPFAIGGVK